MILYRGPSAFNPNEDIVVHARRYDADKLGGNSLGLVIMPLSLLTEHDGNFFSLMRAGGDTCVCGNCPRRSSPSGGDSSCYVYGGSRVGHGISASAGKHRDRLLHEPVIPMAHLSFALKASGACTIRSAVWGDAGAIPAAAWAGIAKGISDSGLPFLAYTHQWADPRMQHLKETHQASCDSVDEAKAAEALGWAVFLVTAAGVTPADLRAQGLEGFGHCPASHEWLAKGKPMVPCVVCKLCTGGSIAKTRNALIWDHSFKNGRAFRVALKALTALSIGASKEAASSWLQP